MAPVIAESHVELRVPDHRPRAMEYGPWIEEEWVNHISNAVKYGGRPPHIELGAAPRPDGSWWRVLKDRDPFSV